MTRFYSLDPIENPEINPLDVKDPSILLNASITKTNKKGEREDHLGAPHESYQKKGTEHH